MLFALTTAMRYFRARKGFVSVVTTFSLLGIMLGVAALIVVMSVMSGFRQELLDRILGTTGHIVISSAQMTESRAADLSTQLQAKPSVTRATPFISGQAMVTSANNALGGYVRAMNYDDFIKNDLISQNLVAGKLEYFKRKDVVVLGKTMAQQLSVTVGGYVNLVSPQGSQTALGFIPRMKRLRVAAIFDVGMHQYDSGLMILPLNVAQSFFKLDDKVTAIEVMIEKPDLVRDVVVKEVAPELSENDFVQDWTKINSQFFEALQVEKAAMFIILSLIVVVAAFNIITGQMMSVNDKIRSIAILRTMGARRRDILLTFTIGGAFVGVVGTLLGTTIGLLICIYLHEIVSFIEQIAQVSIFSGEAYFLAEIPVLMNIADVASVVLMALLLSVTAGLIPALKAARLDPVEALRND